LFYQGTVADGEAFFDGLWPEARAVSDLSKTFYNAFGIKRGGMRELLGPEVWACGVRATAKGHLSGVPVGDPLSMPGLFLVEGDAIIWQHRFRHVGDHPNFARIAEEAARASVKGSGTIGE
jgi:hypothetical protein